MITVKRALKDEKKMIGNQKRGSEEKKKSKDYAVIKKRKKRESVEQFEKLIKNM